MTFLTETPFLYRRQRPSSKRLPGCAKNSEELDVVFIGYGTLNVVRDREIRMVISQGWVSKGKYAHAVVKRAARNDSSTQLKLETV